jgi:5-methyltetrahydrofolate--homocysteine methyltransferase
MSDILAKISRSVIEGDVVAIEGLTEAALSQGCTAEDILSKALVPAMDQVGEAMGRGDMFIPEVLLSARVMQTSLQLIKPGLASSGVKMVGKVVIGTVKGDLHTIGKNLVKMMLEGAGFEVVDLGHDIPAEKFVEAVKQEKPDIVGLSALLTTTMHGMTQTVRALQEAGVRDQVKIIVGGAPVTQEFAAQIGADGYGANAAAAVELAKRLRRVA